jgi:hypothetical protein
MGWMSTLQITHLATFMGWKSYLTKILQHINYRITRLWLWWSSYYRYLPAYLGNQIWSIHHRTILATVDICWHTILVKNMSLHNHRWLPHCEEHVFTKCWPDWVILHTKSVTRYPAIPKSLMVMHHWLIVVPSGHWA